MDASCFLKKERNIKERFSGCFPIELWLPSSGTVAGMLQRLATCEPADSKRSRRREEQMWLYFTYYLQLEIQIY